MLPYRLIVIKPRSRLLPTALLPIGATLLFNLLLKLFLDFVRVIRIAFSLYLRQQMPFIFEKKGVLKYLVSGALSLRLVKVIHVELPDERGEVVVLEVLGQDLVSE